MVAALTGDDVVAILARHEAHEQRFQHALFLDGFGQLTQFTQEFPGLIGIGPDLVERNHAPDGGAAETCEPVLRRRAASCRIFSVTGNPILFDTLDNLQGQLAVFFRARRFRRKRHDRFFVSGALLQAHVLADARLEQHGAEHGANLFVSVAGDVARLSNRVMSTPSTFSAGLGCARIRVRRFRAGRPCLLGSRSRRPGSARAGESGGHQRIYGEDAQRGRRVDDDVVVVLRQHRRERASFNLNGASNCPESCCSS